MSYKQSSRSMSMVLTSAMAAGFCSAPFSAEDAAIWDEPRCVFAFPKAKALKVQCAGLLKPLLPNFIPLPMMPLT